MTNLELHRALRIVWLIVTVITLAMLLTPFVVPEGAVLSASRALALPGHMNATCPMCGMTRAFLAIARFDVAQALAFNRYSVALFGALLVNQLAASVFVWRTLLPSHRGSHHAAA